MLDSRGIFEFGFQRIRDGLICNPNLLPGIVTRVVAVVTHCYFMS